MSVQEIKQAVNNLSLDALQEIQAALEDRLESLEDAADIAASEAAPAEPGESIPLNQVIPELDALYRSP